MRVGGVSVDCRKSINKPSMFHPKETEAPEEAVAKERRLQSIKHEVSEAQPWFCESSTLEHEG
jgi:hypothetical protein